ncbi:hypothetical protein ACX84U_28670, partial [Burkholderia pseudomallei]
ATKNATSSDRLTPSDCALRIRIATRISSSGGSIATVRPESKRGLQLIPIPLAGAAPAAA